MVRTSLAESFSELNLQRSDAITSPKQDSLNLPRSLLLKWKSTYPFHHARQEKPNNTSFTIRMDDCYDYMRFDDDPDELFNDAQGFYYDVAKMMETLNPEQEISLENHLLEMMIRLIFGSNAIEAAGAGYDITLRLCRKVLNGEPVKEDVDERDPDYKKLQEHLMMQNLPADTTAIIRSRREIIQHARALHYIVTQMMLLSHPLSEELILTTHRILTYQVSSPDGQPYETYSGKYREVSVGCGFTNFTPPEAVPQQMAGLIRSFNADIKSAAEAGALDPFSLAAKYCHKFVNIHPFLDGNGRICRLILNAILLKYAGILISLGEEDMDRDEYLAVAARASEAELSACDEEDDGYQRKHWKELATLTVRHAKAKFEHLFKTLSSSEDSGPAGTDSPK